MQNDLLHLLSILDACSKIIVYSKNYTDTKEFYTSNHQLNYNACLTLLSHIGESINNISTELKSKYTTIDWNKIKGLRNRIVHDYPGINAVIVFTIIKNEIPNLKNIVIQIIKDGLKLSFIDKNEYNAAKESEFYKNIDFSEIG